MFLKKKYKSLFLRLNTDLIIELVFILTIQQTESYEFVLLENISTSLLKLKKLIITDSVIVQM